MKLASIFFGTRQGYANKCQSEHWDRFHATKSIDFTSPKLNYLKRATHLNKLKFLKLITRKKRGIHSAHILAYQYAIKNNYEYLVTLDCDLQHNVADIKRFIKELKFNNFVIGSRYILNGKSYLKGYRKLLSYYGNKFLKFIFQSKLNEFTTSFRGFDKKTLKLLLKNKIKSTNYSFFMEVVYFLIQNNIKVREIPIIFNERSVGLSKIPRLEIFRTFFNSIRLKFFNYY